ncbi:MAG: aspartate-semialdehyde dehydrogenase [Phycisphaerales bacterium]|nr:MAG: aspartate-semialdehyde dehydrogenase [Phycisphaerales bacterium]
MPSAMFDNVAIVGATGAVGREFIRLIEERGLRAKRFTLLASTRSMGTTVDVNGHPHEVRDLADASFEGIDIAFFSAGGGRSREFAPKAAAAGAVVIDNSSAFRMDPTVPLVVPEINPDDARNHQGIIANPNCSTIIMAVPVFPLHRVNRLRRIVVSTYQAASGAGLSAMQELEEQSRDVLAGKPPKPRAFPFPIAFNLFSHNSTIGDHGYNEEEIKMVRETRKIFHEPELAVTATCIRVPVMRAHSESINLTFADPMTPEAVREILSDAPGVRVVDERRPQHFPMPIEADGADDILVGRIRQDISQPDGCGIDLFVAGDQLRKGAALNGIQIAELLAKA